MGPTRAFSSLQLDPDVFVLATKATMRSSVNCTDSLCHQSLFLVRVKVATKAAPAAILNSTGKSSEHTATSSFGKMWPDATLAFLLGGS